jgi:probable H4MPT-linked C1 transfer pathway protein
MAEHFATAADVHRLTGRLPPEADLHPAADGGAKTESGSARRLARMIGRDSGSAPLAAWRGLAAWLVEAQLRRIEDACRRVLSRAGLPEDAPLVAAGTGRFVAPELARRLGRPVVEFARLLPDGQADPARVSDCAPAVAVAWLAQRD